MEKIVFSALLVAGALTTSFAVRRLSGNNAVVTPIVLTAGAAAIVTALKQAGTT